MTKNRLIIIGSIALVIAIGIVIFMTRQTVAPVASPFPTPTASGEQPQVSDTPSPQPTESTAPLLKSYSPTQMTDTIKTSYSYLQNSTTGDPTFIINNTEQPITGWYIVTITVNGSSQPYKVILNDIGANGELAVVAGPGTSFQDSNLPDEVKKKL